MAQLRNKDVGRSGNPGQFAPTGVVSGGISDRSDFADPYGDIPADTIHPPLPPRSFKVRSVWGESVVLRTNDVMADEVRMVYKTGQCQALAYALHEKTGWPIVAVLDAGAPDLSEVPANRVPHVIADHLHHALVRRPDGLVVDIDAARDLRDYLAGIPDGGFDDGDYQGRDTEWLDEDEFHPEDCVCLEQCYPNGSYRVVEVNAEDFWHAYSVSSWPDQNVEAGRHYAELVLRRGDG